MSSLSSAVYKIVSESHAKAASVNEALSPIQTVHVGLPVENWVVRRVGDIFRLSIGGYPHTGVTDGKVVVSSEVYDEEWIIFPSKDPDLYVILVARKNTTGWTVSPDESGNPEIVIDDTTKFQPNQLFRFVPVEE